MSKTENMKNCPFCDGKVYDNNDSFICIHENDCYLLWISCIGKDISFPLEYYTIIPKNDEYIKSWNKRIKLVRSREKNNNIKIYTEWVRNNKDANKTPENNY